MIALSCPPVFVSRELCRTRHRRHDAAMRSKESDAHV